MKENTNLNEPYKLLKGDTIEVTKQKVIEMFNTTRDLRLKHFVLKLQEIRDINEMKEYLKAEIDSYPVESYKDMDREMKLYLHKLYSFLYFCNECDNINHAKRCITNMANTTTFKDRNVILNLMR